MDDATNLDRGISYERNWSAVEVFVSFEQERISQESIIGTNNQAAATA